MMLRLNNIIKYTVVDGHGVRLSIYTQGCPHNCPGCHNPQTHDAESGQLVDLKGIMTVIENTPYISGVTVTGGEPLMQYEAVTELCRLVKERTDLNITIYTGYQYEEVAEKFPLILEHADFVVDGPYLREQKSYDLYFVGSSNQRYIDVKKTKDAGNVVCHTLTAGVGRRSGERG